jgi:hypothetical protein
MRREVGTQVGQHLPINRLAFLPQLMQNPRLGMHVVEDHAVRDQVVVLDPLPLLRAIIRRDDALSAKEQPLDKAIEGLTFVGRGLNGLTRTDSRQEGGHQ